MKTLYITWRPCTFIILSRRILLVIFQTKAARKIKTRSLCSLTLSRKKTGRLWNTMEKNMVHSSWNLMAHGEAREGKWRGNWRMEWVASTLHTTSEHGVSSITTADAHTSAASSQLNCRPRRFKWTRPFSRRTKSGFCACAITFQTQSTARHATDNNTAHAQCILNNYGYTTHTHRCVILIVLPPQQWLRERVSELCLCRCADKSLSRPAMK